MCTGSLSSSPAQEPGNEASVAYDSGIQFKPYCRVMVSVRDIERVLKAKMLSLWQQWLVSSCSGRSMNFREKDYITHVSPCLPGMDKWANNFCKWRAECFHRFLIIVALSMAGILHTREIHRQTEVSVTEQTLQKFLSSPEKPGEPCMRKQCVPGAPSDFVSLKLEFAMRSYQP